MSIRSITEMGDWSNKVVIVRSSLNVPLENNQVRNEFRLKNALPTIQYLQSAGAVVLIIGHIGRAETDTLRPVYDVLNTHIPMSWVGSVLQADLQTLLRQAPTGSVFMAENIRQHEEERINDIGFSTHIASLGDVYVNDAFANCHRDHASMVGVPTHLPAYAGLQVVTEVTALEAARAPVHPGLFILGGAKFETKLRLVEQYLQTYEHIFIGGALAHDVLLARGYSVGKSLVSDVSLADASFIHSEQLLLPVDVIVQTAAGETKTVPVDAVAVDDVIMDCGPDTIAMLQPYITEAKTILWNGPLGNYEAGYRTGTEALATALADAGAATYVGGGDTVAAIEAVGRNADLTFISTGGGAMLSYLEAGTLPALEPLQLS